MKTYTRLIYTGLLLLAVVAAGCVGSGMPVHQYTLEVITDREQPRDPGVAIQGMVLVGPVNLPRQYAGSSIVTRLGPGVVHTSATHVWAAPLDGQIASTLARVLSLLLASDRVTVFPGPRFGEKKWQLVLDVRQFSGRPGKDFTCDLTWTLNDLVSRKIVERRDFSLTLPVKGDGYRDYTGAASAALAAFSREMSPVLAEVAGQGR